MLWTITVILIILWLLEVVSSYTMGADSFIFCLSLQSYYCTSKDRRSEMKKIIFMAVLMIFGLALFPGCASIKGETTGEYIDDSTITTKKNLLKMEDKK